MGRQFFNIKSSIFLYFFSLVIQLLTPQTARAQSEKHCLFFSTHTHSTHTAHARRRPIFRGRRRRHPELRGGCSPTLTGISRLCKRCAMLLHANVGSMPVAENTPGHTRPRPRNLNLNLAISIYTYTHNRSFCMYHTMYLYHYHGYIYIRCGPGPHRERITTRHPPLPNHPHGPPPKQLTQLHRSQHPINTISALGRSH